jgi:flagellar basal body-associated protein FliL
MENSEIQSPMQEQPKPKSQKGLVILLVIVIFALIAAIIIIYTKSSQKIEQQTEVQQIIEDQKTSLQKELTDMIGEYDALKTNNDSMNKMIAGQQEKIKRLLSERSGNITLITKYKKELGTLREVLKSYIAQVDSLNTRNQQLVQENVQVKTNLEQARNENIKISQEKDQLSNQVQKASVITTSNIVVTPLNKRGKDENKLKNMLKVKVCFTMRENSIAKAGTKEVYIRLTRPDGSVIAGSQTDVFDFQGQQIAFTAKREVDYENKDIDVCIFWDNNKQLILGEYTVDLFTDGSLIGTTKFNIKK